MPNDQQAPLQHFNVIHSPLSSGSDHPVSSLLDSTGTTCTTDNNGITANISSNSNIHLSHTRPALSDSVRITPITNDSSTQTDIPTGITGIHQENTYRTKFDEHTLRIAEKSDSILSNRHRDILARFDDPNTFRLNSKYKQGIDNLNSLLRLVESHRNELLEAKDEALLKTAELRVKENNLEVERERLRVQCEEQARYRQDLTAEQEDLRTKCEGLAREKSLLEEEKKKQAETGQSLLRVGEENAKRVTAYEALLSKLEEFKIVNQQKDTDILEEKTGRLEEKIGRLEEKTGRLEAEKEYLRQQLENKERSCLQLAQEVSQLRAEKVALGSQDEMLATEMEGSWD